MALFISKILFVQVSPAPVVVSPMKLKAPPPKTTRPALVEVAFSTLMLRIAAVPSLMLKFPVKVEAVPDWAWSKVKVPLPDFVTAWRSPLAVILPVKSESPPPVRVRLRAVASVCPHRVAPVRVTRPVALLVMVGLLLPPPAPKALNVSPQPLRLTKTVLELVPVVRRVPNVAV